MGKRTELWRGRGDGDSAAAMGTVLQQGGSHERGQCWYSVLELDRKRWIEAGRISWLDENFADPGPRRALIQPCPELYNRSSVPLDPKFDGAVGKIAHPATKIEPEGFSSRAVAESHPLNSTRHDGAKRGLGVHRRSQSSAMPGGGTLSRAPIRDSSCS